MSIRDKLADKKTKLADRVSGKVITEDHPAKLNNFKDGDPLSVEIVQIIPNPNQPRKYFDPQALEELSQSIKQNGVLQPVIITIKDDNKIYLIAGERRFRAAKMAGLTKIPAVYSTGNFAEIALIENIQREDLNPIETAESLMRISKEYNYTQEKLAFIIGKSKSTVSETLSLNKLPEEIKAEVRRAEQYPRRLLIEVAKQDTHEKMFSLVSIPSTSGQ